MYPPSFLLVVFFIYIFGFFDICILGIFRDLFFSVLFPSRKYGYARCRGNADGRDNHTENVYTQRKRVLVNIQIVKHGLRTEIEKFVSVQNVKEYTYNYRHYTCPAQRIKRLADGIQYFSAFKQAKKSEENTYGKNKARNGNYYCARLINGVNRRINTRKKRKRDYRNDL